MEVLKVDDTNSVLIRDGDIEAWVDVWVNEGEIEADWNAYIFQCDNDNDMRLKAWQEDPNNFEVASSLAINHLIQQAKI